MTFLSERRVWLPALVLLSLGVVLYLPLLGETGLWDPWEPRYAQTAREMSAGGQWIIPYYRGDPRLNKPPMTYWLIRISQSVFGTTETAARLPSALLAILCPLCLALAFAARGRALVGFVAGAALLTSPQWLLLGRFATPDMPLASFLGLALALAVVFPAVVDPRSRRILLALVASALAAAVLTDGLRALLLPLWGVLGWGALRLGFGGVTGLAVVVAFYHAGQLTESVPLHLVSFALTLLFVPLILVRRAGLERRGALLALALFVLLVAPWFVAAYRLEPAEMSVLGYKHGLNLGESVGEHTGPYDYPLRIMVIGGLPWAALAIVGWIESFGAKRDELATLLAGSFLGALLFFTSSEAQMGHFYGVTQPALAGLAGLGAIALARRRDWTLLPALAALGGILWLVIDEPSRILETATVKANLFRNDLSILVVVVCAAWGLALGAAWSRRRESWTVTAVLPAAVLAGALGFWLVPALGPGKTIKALWLSYVSERKADEPIAAFLNAKDSGYYYGNGAILRVHGSDDLAEFLRPPGDKFLIMPKEAQKKLRRADPTHWEMIDESHPSHVLVRYRPAGIPINSNGQ